MRISFLEVIGLNRLLLINVKRFCYTPQEKIQLLLGTNGSGKSAVLRELSPLPAEPRQYSKEGEKTICLTHNGCEYLLKSWFHSGGGHSFQKDGQELNKGQTITVQKELVWQEFGYNQAIHYLLTGNDDFTEMSPTQRREWFTRLCDVNYDYALGRYNKIRERSRDTTGALKDAQKRLVAELSKVVEKKDIDELNAKIAHLHQEMDALYQARESQPAQTNVLSSQGQQLESDLIKQCQALFSIRSYFSARTMFHPDEYAQDIDDRRQELTRLKTEMDLLVKEHNELSESVKVFQQTGGSSVEELKTRLNELQRNKTTLLDSQVLKLVWGDVRAAQAALNSIIELLTETLTALPENRDRKYSQAALLEAKEKELVIRESLSKAQQSMEKLRHTRDHLDQLKKGDTTQCPQCKHQWVVGYSDEAYARVVKAIESGCQYIEEQSKLQKNLNDVIEQNNQYGDLYRNYVRCVRSLPALEPLWSYLQAQEYVNNSPRFALTQINVALRDLAICVEAHGISETIERTQHLLELAIKANQADMGKLVTRLEKIDEQLGSLTKQSGRAQQLLNECISHQQRSREFLRLGDAIHELQSRLEENTQDQIKALKNEIIAGCIKDLQLTLAKYQNTLNDINMQNGIVRDIEQQIERLTLQDQAYKLVVKELSPTEGLIAEGLLGFIRAYLKKVNRIIQKVWTYPMQVLDCNNDPEAAELDYKFPFQLKDLPKPVDDVREASSGQKEIINMAFRVVAPHYLGLKNWPLFFDEPGSRLDRTHKLAIPSLIQALLDQTDVQQVFIISHDFTQYGSISNCDITVMNPDNVVVPAIHNQCVEMA